MTSGKAIGVMVMRLKWGGGEWRGIILELARRSGGTASDMQDSINQFYLLKMSRDTQFTHIRLFNCEQDNKAETSTNSCPTNKLQKKKN